MSTFASAEKSNGYVIDHYGMRRLPIDNELTVFGITYELSSDRLHQKRTVYSVTDYLSNIGGLSSALQPICYLLVVILQYRGSYMYIMNDN